MFPFEDPAPSGPSQSPSRSAGAAGACGTASAAGLTHKMHTSVTVTFFCNDNIFKKKTVHMMLRNSAVGRYTLLKRFCFHIL